MAQQPTPVYEFGPFRVDPVERVLRRQGEPIPLTSKVFDILLLRGTARARCRAAVDADDLA
jgi:DNA-binding winged helix-turn-helix (wHTH) protein